MDAAHVSENTLWKKVKFITQISRKRFRFNLFGINILFKTNTMRQRRCFLKPVSINFNSLSILSDNI